MNVILGWGDVGYGGCEPRVESIFLGWVGWGDRVGGGQGGCERRIEVFVKIQKTNLGGGGGLGGLGRGGG